MSFSYDTTTDIGKVRFAIGDVTSGAGIKPDGTNLSDEEIQLLVTREGSWGAAAAACCETLAVWYARVVTIAVGPRREDLGAIRQAYTDLAARLRLQYGGGGVAHGFSAGVVRVDGYSQDVASDAVTPAEDTVNVGTPTEYGSRVIYVIT